jgi:hypothetical protein
MTTFKDSILQIINARTLLITTLSVVLTFVCRLTGFEADLPITFVMSAVVFPIVFSINAAYTRRETALDRYGSLKASGQSIFYLARDWNDDKGDKWLIDIKKTVVEIFEKIQQLIIDEEGDLREKETSVYQNFSKLSNLIAEGCKRHHIHENEASLCNSHLKDMLLAFETLKHIFQYRTPTTLRTFSRLFITALPILYAPYFAFVSSGFGIILVIMMPILFTVTLASLGNIQMHLENPFDQVGEDDISINVESFARRLQNNPF